MGRTFLQGGLGRGAACLLLTPLIFTGCGSEAVTTPRGVLLISIDSLRSDHLSCYGYEPPAYPGQPSRDTTPAIDAMLAAEGALFEVVVSTTSWTLPSHLAMLTGRPNELHGVQEIPDRLPNEVPLLAESMGAAGYRTAGFWSGPNLHPWFGFERGFEEYVDCSSRPMDDPEAFALNDEAADHEAVMAAHDDSHQGITGERVVDSFEEWFGGLEEDEPFFAFVHLWDVHYDYVPPPEYDVFGDPTYRGRIDGHDFTDVRIAPHQTADMARLISLYDGEILFTDQQVRRLLTGLDLAGRLDDTLVILTSDHGEAFGEHKMLGHKHSLHGEELRIPLIMRYPASIPAGLRIDDVSSLVDLVPTIHEFCDLPLPEGVWGRSLAPLATGEVEDLPERAAPLELTTRYNGRVQRGFRWQDDKFVDRGEGGQRVWLDLESDPREWDPVRANDPGPKPDFRRREGEADVMWRQIDADRPARREEAALPEGLTTDLEAAGYLGGEKD